MTAGGSPPLCRLLRCVLVSHDAARLATFYEQALGCRRLAPAHRAGAAFTAATGVAGGALSITLELGSQRIELLQFARGGRPYPAGTLASDLLFQHCAVVVRDMHEALRRLSAVAGWTAISGHGPQRLPASSGGVTAFKFRDPEGHPLELLAFPAAGLPAHWRQAPGSDPCIGIDHSAISVSDGAASVAFYQGLGLRVTGASTNTGAEQARLDGLAEPHVEVTALAAEQATPHLELLCYRRTQPGAPAAMRNSDIAATRLLWQVRSMPGTRSCAGYPQPLADPDGHRLLLVAAR